MKGETVLVTGGAGYVGSVLVPKLLSEGYRVKVLDLYIYGDRFSDEVRQNANLQQIKGDIRDELVLERELTGTDIVIHLACISNDPSFELDPTISKSINYDAFSPLVRISKSKGVRRFIYASTSSVYGVSESPNVTEDHPLIPLTDYNKYKGLCEPLLLDQQSSDFTTIVIRPATVCGYSPRQRLDLTVNILTNLAVNTGRITVFGGSQMRPNIHIEDLTNLYIQLLDEEDGRVAGQIFNAGYQNHAVSEIASIIGSTVQHILPERDSIETVTTPSDDNRSYHISSEKIAKELGFVPQLGIEDAVRDLCMAFSAGKLPNSLTDNYYFNVKRMQEIGLR